jgi:hypothetical protein
VSSVAKNRVLNIFRRLYAEKGAIPSYADLLANGVTRNMIRHHFGNLSELAEAAVKISNNNWINFDQTRDDREKAAKKLKNSHTRFFITTAVKGESVNIEFLKAIDTYCDLNNAALIILWTKNKRFPTLNLVDPLLAKYAWIITPLKLNKNLSVFSDLHHLDPVRPPCRIDALVQQNGSLIMNGAAQWLKIIPRSIELLPSAAMSTGSITSTHFAKDNKTPRTRDLIHSKSSTFGGIVVELVDDLFHFRQVQAAQDGSFVDLGVRYSAKGTASARCDAMILGDWHEGETDDTVAKVTYEMIKFFYPERLVLHDFFNGTSVNHHEEHNNQARIQSADITLEKELAACAATLERFKSLNQNLKEIVIVKSNHDEWLARFLRRPRFMEADAVNRLTLLKLASAMMVDNKDPLEFGIMEHIKDNSDLKRIVRFLKRDQDYFVHGIQLGAHGDLGSNGRPGTLADMASAYGSSVTGHSHTPGIINGAWAVGTSTKLKLNYNQGASSWVNTHCVIYDDGSRQLLNIIKGQWRS